MSIAFKLGVQKHACTCIRFSSYRNIIGMLNNADSAQAVITKARALHPAIKINVYQLTDYISISCVNR